jgi:hypothetical protein
MSLRSATPARIRAHYLRAVQALPLKAPPPASPPEAAALTVLGAARIDGRTVAFATAADHPRLWIAVHSGSSSPPSVIGYVTGLVVGRPDLWVTDADSWSWVSGADITAQIKNAAARVWFDCERTCDG